MYVIKHYGAYWCAEEKNYSGVWHSTLYKNHEEAWSVALKLMQDTNQEHEVTHLSSVVGEQARNSAKEAKKRQRRMRQAEYAYLPNQAVYVPKVPDDENYFGYDQVQTTHLILHGPCVEGFLCVDQEGYWFTLQGEEYYHFMDSYILKDATPIIRPKKQEPPTFGPNDFTLAE